MRWAYSTAVYRLDFISQQMSSGARNTSSHFIKIWSLSHVTIFVNKAVELHISWQCSLNLLFFNVFLYVARFVLHVIILFINFLLNIFCHYLLPVLKKNPRRQNLKNVLKMLSPNGLPDSKLSNLTWRFFVKNWNSVVVGVKLLFRAARTHMI